MFSYLRTISIASLAMLCLVPTAGAQDTPREAFREAQRFERQMFDNSWRANREAWRDNWRYGYPNNYPNNYWYGYRNPYHYQQPFDRYRYHDDFVPERQFSNAPITIRMASNASGRVVYSLNGHDYTMLPGQSQTFHEDRQWVIRFDRGGDFGSGEYFLSPGNYEFRKSSRGWELYRHHAGVAISPRHERSEY